MFFHVLFQMSFLTESFWGHGTLKRPLRCMNGGHVIFQCSFLAEKLSTNITFVWFMTFMHTEDMFLHVTMTTEGFWALGTHKRPFSFMDIAYVVSHATFFGKFHMTNVTFVWFVTFMHSGNVPLHTHLQAESF